ncbi:ferrochelatase [Candidatus Albibeggiatoa sp. nov. NOAA]|uniref:ferrochelatase n=1 Tax=Candidatus Albibeggiatoa sp. nov. NOAA TaxID=3162724 RepID=UPI0032F5ADB4|nr:ferrochelatase [Thiotrichaceae bacterium]
MKSYLNSSEQPHSTLPVTGILLTNLGTPDAPTPTALRRYLAEFLSDPRITELPRWLWWPILHGIILRTRPARSAKNYAKIWTDEGSPLFTISQQQTKKLQALLSQHFDSPVQVALGMRYGQPSIETGLEQLRQVNAQRIIVLPLYPQYSSSTTGSTYDAIGDCLKKWRWIPDLQFISHYHDNEGYINALASSVRHHWDQHGQPDKLLFSFHGVPRRFLDAGDPYFCECHKTARLVATTLDLKEDQYQVVFQSRFGREEWIKPYTDETLKKLPKQGVKHVNVICPGFSADCLETLEEIDQENRAYFLESGGEQYHYIPALNAQDAHMQALANLVIQRAQAWSLKSTDVLQSEQEQRLLQVEKVSKIQS